jgi:hypothetical protein
MAGHDHDSGDELEEDEDHEIIDSDEEEVASQ